MKKKYVLSILFAFVSILSFPCLSHAGPLSEIMDNDLERLCQIARLLLKDGPYQASGKAMDDYDKISSRELCKKFESDMRLLCRHNDRDFADCCCALSQILYIKSKNVSLTPKVKQATLKALQCTLVYLCTWREAVIAGMQACLGEEDYDFLKTWDILPYIQRIGALLKELCISHRL
ncbi:MAG: hypothetical protein LBD69_04595 [Puniceicoccales bacterium]|jgi:hypothetical protein|nr:hypothetical protein [Puniceicoccales bacterium]